jgi:hypothetical protein
MIKKTSGAIRKIVMVEWQPYFLSCPSLWDIETSRRGFVIFLLFWFPSDNNNIW